MTAYAIRFEPCSMPATTSGPYDIPPRHFRYTIRRADGSLVFRLETQAEAAQILDRLNGEEWIDELGEELAW